VLADTSDADRVDAAFVELGERFSGGLNVLINTVGSSAGGTFEELIDDQWRAAVDDGVLLAKDEVLVNVVSPGSIASEASLGWADSVGVDGSDPYRLMKAIDEHFGHPAHLPRAGLPEEIAAVAAILASRRNSYTTGAYVNVDGGPDFI
jgi:3-oxoacyl-[acyl-carrier protein] reductase